MLRITFLAGLLTVCAQAQGVNCTLLGHLDHRSSYNDVWGYTAPNGDEYAILCLNSGTSIIDVTVPSAPVERAFFSGSNSTWRDARTYGSYAYVVTEASGGFQIINMSNPNSPSLVGTVGAGVFNNAHNICLDPGTGRIYIVGGNSSANNPVFDASINPTNPPLLGSALPVNAGNPNSSYFHDMQVENGYAYGAMIYNGDLRIMDASSLPCPILSSVATPGTFTHNAWPNAAGTVCVTTDEVSGGVVKFWDITNKSNPLPLGQYTPNGSSIPHNAYIVGDLCHVSWYTEGYRCIDISDPNNPVEVASYDTWPGATGGYNGNWGCYPFLASGNILVSDRATGLYIVKPNLTDLQLAHTPLPDTFDEDNPYPVTCTVSGSNPITGVTLTYAVGGGGSTTVNMTPTGTPGQYSADIPAQQAPVSVSYHIDATDTVGSQRSPASGEHSFFVGTLIQLFFDDVETDLGWTHGLIANQDDWQRGSPNGASGTSGGAGWADPPSAYSGSLAWGNDLAPSGFNGAYQNNTTNWLQSPPIATSSVQGLRFRYRRHIDLASGDQGRVLVNRNLVATVPANTRDNAWQWIEHDISAIANSATTLTLRFELITDGSQVGGGWTLDDFEIYIESDCAPPEFYGPATAGTGGIDPTIGRSGELRLGSVSNVDGGSLLGGATGFLALGFGPDNTSVFGITALVDSSTALFLFGIANGAPGVAGAGSLSLPIAVPNNSILDGLDLFNQMIMFDSGSVGGTFSASPGMRSRVCSQ